MCICLYMTEKKKEMINVDWANNDIQIDGKEKHYEIMVGVFGGLDSN